MFFASARTPEERLLRAVAHGASEEEAKGLLAMGADPDGPAGNPPLAWAAGAGRIDLAAALLDEGANPRAVLSTGWDAMMCAVGGGKRGMVEFLSEPCDPGHAAGDGTNALLLALACRSRRPDWEWMASTLARWQGTDAVSTRFGAVFDAFASGCSTTGDDGSDVTEERALGMMGILLDAGAVPTEESIDRMAETGWTVLSEAMGLALATMGRGSTAGAPGSV